MLFLFPTKAEPFIFSAVDVFAEAASAFYTVWLPLCGQVGHTIHNQIFSEFYI